jgi:hypothetical protein
VGEKIVSLTYLMYIGSVMLGRLKYITADLGIVLLRVTLLLKNLKGINYKVFKIPAEVI